MLEGLHSAAAGMAAQQQRLDAVANDLANANTTGYKHVRVGFRDLVYTPAGRSSTQGPQTGAGAAAVDAGRGLAQGALQRTDQPLDVATQGALEMSNTDVADAMVAMIESQRAFQLTSKAIQTQDQMWEIANGVKR